MKLSEYLQHLGRTVAYYPRLTRITGGVAETVFLCQLIYWRGKQADSEGWCRKSRDEITQETGLSRREQETARKNLRDRQFVSEKRRGVPATIHFLVNLEVLNAAWEEFTSPTSCTDPPNWTHDSAQLDAQISPSIKEALDDALDDSTRKERARQSARRKQIPNGYTPSGPMFEWARKNFPTIDAVAETAQFYDYHRARASTMVDWEAAWRTWIRKAEAYAKSGRKGHKPYSDSDEWGVA